MKKGLLFMVLSGFLMYFPLQAMEGEKWHKAKEVSKWKSNNDREWVKKKPGKNVESPNSFSALLENQNLPLLFAEKVDNLPSEQKELFNVLFGLNTLREKEIKDLKITVKKLENRVDLQEKKLNERYNPFSTIPKRRSPKIINESKKEIKNETRLTRPERTFNVVSEEHETFC